MTGIGINLHLMTRGSSKDYRFIGNSQVERWWTKYSKWARFEAPTIIIEYGRFYLSGITSARRRDRVGTPIRYVLAGDGIKDSDAIRIVMNLIAKATEELKNNFAGLAESFDKIDNDIIEKALADDDDATEEVLAVIGRQLQDLPNIEKRADMPERPWCSGVTEDGLLALVATAESVLKGDTHGGLAAYLNLADEKDVRSALSRGRFVGIVVKVGPNLPKALARPLKSLAVGLSIFLITAVALVAWRLAQTP